MTKYITVDTFTDTQDEGVAYPIGALYPREGYEPSTERIAALASGDNAKGVVLIQPIIELPAKEVKKTAKKAKKADDTVDEG